MSKYVEKNLGKNETIVKKADLNGLFLVAAWIKGILFCWLLLIPTIKAIIATVRFKNIELAITTKRIIGKIGVANTQALDAPLNKVQNVAVAQPFFGKIFNYATVKIITLAGPQDYVMRKSGVISSTDKLHEFRYVKASEEFKNLVMDFQAKVVQH